MKKIIICFSLLNSIYNLNPKNNYECFNGYFECINSCCIKGKCIKVNYCNNEKINIFLIYIITIIIFFLIILLYILIIYYIGKNFNLKKTKKIEHKKYFNMRNSSEVILNNYITNNITKNNNNSNKIIYNNNNNFEQNNNINILENQDLKKNYINTVDIIEEVEESIYKTTIENFKNIGTPNNFYKNNNNNYSMKIEFKIKNTIINQKQNNISYELNELKRTNSF
jgi:hypothetical protein